jgi:hypothetical protein
MAKSAVPGALERRHLIESETGEAQALKIAEAYLAADRLEEALIFLEKAGATERLTELRAGAVAAGDVFLLRSAARSMGESPSREEWLRVETIAATAGRELYAADAHRQLEVEPED